MVKKDFLKHLAFVVIMLIAGVSASHAQSYVELIATGDGATKQAATLSALRSALEQVYGTMVSSNTKILNDELVKDEIVSISTGIVKKYTYMEEKEVGGKWYVVLKAIVSTQKLVSYAQSKGASAELAGATFAANVRLKNLNEKNARIAYNNISEMQAQFLPQCLDFSIINISEPKECEGGYLVEFSVKISLNSNASIIQDLESQKPHLSFGGGAYPATNCIKMIFDKFKIVDDINEYFLDFYIEPNQEYAKDSHKFRVNINRKTPNNVKLRLIHGNDFVSTWLCSSNGKMRNPYYHNEEFVVYSGENCHVLWKYVTPNRPIMIITIPLVYKLEDLEKITGIHVVLKDSEGTASVTTTKVPQSLTKFGWTDGNWEQTLSLNEEEFMESISMMRKEVYPKGHGNLTGKRTFPDEMIDTLIQEYRNAKK